MKNVGQQARRVAVAMAVAAAGSCAVGTPQISQPIIDTITLCSGGISRENIAAYEAEIARRSGRAHAQRSAAIEAAEALGLDRLTDETLLAGREQYYECVREERAADWNRTGGDGPETGEEANHGNVASGIRPEVLGPVEGAGLLVQNPAPVARNYRGVILLHVEWRGELTSTRLGWRVYNCPRTIVGTNIGAYIRFATRFPQECLIEIRNTEGWTVGSFALWVVEG